MCYLFDWKNFIHEIEDKCSLESDLEIYLHFLNDWCYKRTWKLIVVKCRKNTKNLN